MKRWTIVALFLLSMSWPMAYGQTKQQWIDSLNYYETNLTQALTLLNGSKQQTEILSRRLQQALSKTQSLRLSLERATQSQEQLEEDLKKLYDSYSLLWSEYESIKKLLDAQYTDRQKEIEGIMKQHSAELAIAQRKTKLLRILFYVAVGIAAGEAVWLISK